MSEPVIVARADHPISRASIDPDALKVLTRLHEANYTAYLVGGSVRDLLLGRRPKDFDIGTSAHPYQIKKLFRNCWIIGRRFRLAHVKFGDKAIEVATFRRQVPASAEAAVRRAGDRREPRPRPRATAPARPRNATCSSTATTRSARRKKTRSAATSRSTRSSTTSPTVSIIDYVGGLDDLRARVIRSIGDPNERFQEDPVRMLRAVVLAARLDFTIDPPVRSGHRSRTAIGWRRPRRRG